MARASLCFLLDVTISIFDKLIDRFERMDLSWSQTPNSVWWALEKSGSTTSLLGDSLTSPVTPSRMPGSSFAINNFYEYADEPDLGESEEDIVEWMKESQLRGAIRYCQVFLYPQC